MTQFSNNSNITLSMAVWLATDDYDHNDKVISVTTLLKPIKQTVLASRVDLTELPKADLLGRLSSRMGTAIHDSVERTWLNPTKVKQVMEVLGYPKRLINALVVNPDPTTVTEDQFAVYLEQRAEKQVGSLTVSGKFDAVFDGVVEDIKTTKTYGYIKGNKVQDYILQGSMYKWLNPNIITGDVIRINYMFTDWLGASSYQQGYPAAAQISEEYELMTIPQTEQWVRNRINQIQNLWDKPESDMPYCTDEELWRDAPAWKYYKKGKANQSRSTKNFDNKIDAYNYYASEGHVGEIIEVSGEVRACKWCPAFSVCTQKNQYIIDGSLKI